MTTTDDIATLRADLATSEAACASAMAENEALRADLANTETELARIRNGVRHVVQMARRGTPLAPLMARVIGLERYLPETEQHP